MNFVAAGLPTTGASPLSADLLKWVQSGVLVAPAPNKITLIALETAGRLRTEGLGAWYEWRPGGDL